MKKSLYKMAMKLKFDAMIFKVVGPVEPAAHSDFEEEAERTQFRPVVNVPAPKPAPKHVSPAPVNHRPSASAPAPKATPAPAPEPSPVVNITHQMIRVIVVAVWA
jgi:hypothetical protein